MDRRTALIAIGQFPLLAAEYAPDIHASGELLKGGTSMVHPWVVKSHSVLGDKVVTAMSRIRGDQTEGEHVRFSCKYHHCSGSLGGAEVCVSAFSCGDFVFTSLTFRTVLKQKYQTLGMMSARAHSMTLDVLTGFSPSMLQVQA